MDRIFQIEVENIKELEGNYVDHPSDPGGKTRWGISEWLARAYDYHGPVSELPWRKAKQIYHKEYWIRNHYDEIKYHKLAGEMLEQSINLPSIEVNGRKVLKANVNLQKAYNLVSDKSIIVDGIIGPNTLKAINKCPKITGLFNVLNGYQAKHYIEVSEKYPNLRDFIVGWFNKRITIIRRS